MPTRTDAMSLLNTLVGRPLSSSEQDQQKIGVLAAVPAMGLDGLSSSAYGPEAALTLLVPLGAAGLHWIEPITFAVLALLVLLGLSYRQTIAAYPVNGGSYTVAKDNLGRQASLTCAAALMVDYILNVAVGISAGVAALTSAFPQMHRFTLPVCLGVLAVITLVNLRGTGEAGVAFSVPTYGFLLMMAIVLVVGLTRALHAGGHPAPLVRPPPVPKATEAVGLWILMRAFASGCTAMTGVEAVSNGVTAFRDPPVKYAHRTLTVIVVALAILLGGIATLCRAYGISAMDQSHPGYQSVLSQLTAAVFGKGWAYYVTIAAVLSVLCLSANTSFVGFPRLCRLAAEDAALPRAFAMVGRRLVLSVGILFLAAAAGSLLIAFKGITDKLIPLYAVGAFLAFTLSQTGMVVHWRRQKEDGRRHLVHLAVNGTGAVATAVALVVIIAAKFVEGAWIVILAIPALVGLFNLVHRYYRNVERELASDGRPLDLSETRSPVVVLPMRQANRLTDRALAFALRMSCDVIAIHLANVGGSEADSACGELRVDWVRRVEDPARAAGLPPPKMVFVESPYRLFLDPLLDALAKIQADHPDRQIAVIVPQLVKRHLWQRLLHDHRGERLKRALADRGGHGIVVVSVPWHLDEDGPPRADPAVDATAGRP
jgi:amino acid transporter